MYSQQGMNENRKRSIPSNTPAFPSKRLQRLSSVKDRPSLNHNDNDSFIGSQRPIHNHDSLTDKTYTLIDTESSQANSSSIISVYSVQRPHRPNAHVSSIKNPLDLELAQQFKNGEHLSLKKFPSDPRNIKDSDTQRQYLHAITEYLDKTGYKASSLHRNIRVLSSKEFHSMLKHLVLRLDPNYRPRRKFEDEVVDLLKKLRYPLRDSISPKSLLSIGAIHSNPTFFALLHWMVQTCKAADLNDSEEFQEPTKLEMEQDPLAKVFNDYLISTYHVFMNAGDDYNAQEKTLKNAFDQLYFTTEKEKDEIQLDLSELRKRDELLKSRVSPINDLIRRNQELLRDIAKFREYCEEKKQRVSKYENLNKRVKDEIKRLRKEQQTLELEKTELQDRLIGKNVSIDALREIHAKYQADERKNADLTSQLEQRRSLCNQKAEILSKLREKVHKDVEEYNSKARKLFPHMPHNQDMVITFNPTATTADEMISINIEQFIIPKLDSLEQNVKDEFAKVTQETQTLREELEASKADIDQSKSELASRQKEYEAKKKKYEETHHKFMMENEKFNVMVDKHERAAEDERSEARTSMIQAKESLFAQEEKLKEMNRTFKQEQEALASRARELINQFSDHQKRLLSSTESLLKLAHSQNSNIE